MALPNVRKMFIPDPGMTMFDIDLDSADLRIVVWESECEGMWQWLMEGKKPYVEVAKEYYQDPSITKEHKQYKIFKSLCHGTNYLGEAKGLAGRLGLTEGDVKGIQEWYFGKFPEIRKWQQEVIKQIQERRYVENVFGYRMWFPGRLTEKTFRDAVAAIPQSTVACLINRGWKRLWEREPEVEVLLQVHDSLMGQFPSVRPELREKIVECCTIALPYRWKGECVIPVGCAVSDVSWGDCR